MQALHDQYGLCSCKLYMLQINSITMCVTHNFKDQDSISKVVTMKTSKQDLKKAKIIGLHPKSLVMLKKTCGRCRKGNPCAKKCQSISHKCSFCDYVTKYPNHFWVHVKKNHAIFTRYVCLLY